MRKRQTHAAILDAAISHTTQYLNSQRIDSRCQNYGNALPRGVLSLDVDTLRPGKYKIDDIGQGVIEVDIVEVSETSQSRLIYQRKRALEMRELWRQGEHRDDIQKKFRVNRRYLTKVLMGQVHTRAIKRAERLDDTGGRLNLFGCPVRQQSVLAKRAASKQGSAPDTGHCA